MKKTIIIISWPIRPTDIKQDMVFGQGLKQWGVPIDYVCEYVASYIPTYIICIEGNDAARIPKLREKK